MQLLRVPIPNPDELLATSALGAGAVIHVQSGPAQAGPWADITNAKTALVANQYGYLIADQPGTDATWYQWRVENSGGTTFGDWTIFQPLTQGYVALGDVKQRLNQPDTWTPVDGLLINYIAAASAFVENRTGRTFYPNPLSGSVQQLFDGWALVDGGSVAAEGKCLIVPRGIVSLTTVEVATYTGAAYNTIPSGDWFLRPVVWELDPGWPYTELWITNIPSSTDATPSFYPGFATTRLTGVFGWPKVPYDIWDLVGTLVVSRYHARGAGGGDAYTTDADGSRTFERLLSLTDLKTIHRYTLKRIAIV